MEEISCKLTVYFDDPFWAAVCERQYAGQLEAAKVVFGAEPKDYEAVSYTHLWPPPRRAPGA